MTDESLFHDALAQPPAERAAYLERACGGQPELKSAVAALLAAHQSPESLLDSPPAGAMAFMPPPDEQRRHVEVGAVIAGRNTLVESVGDYRILREIGRGGMGVVYEAEQQALGRRVALKLLPRASAGDGSAQIRFQREAKAAARMHHTNIVPVFDVGQDGEHLYYAMQLIRGQGLDLVIEDLKRLRARSEATPEVPDRVADRTISASLAAGKFEREDLAPARETDPSATAVSEGKAPSTAVLPGQSAISTATTDRGSYYRSVAQIGVQTAAALSYAHCRGIIHRDIKPGNLILDTTGNVWVTDFGLAKTGDGGVTHTGDILGTVRYMSPERFRGQCDVRADVYGLGMTLYELLTLQAAYASGDRLKLIDLIRHADAASPRSVDAQIPRDLETIVMKAIDKDAKRRYPSAEEMGKDLQRFVNDEPILARRQTLLEHYVRWVRRHPGIAVLGALLTAVLVLATAGSLIVASRMADLAWNEREAADNERKARKETEQALATVDDARDKAQRAVVKFDITTAAQQAERNEPELALHWVARAWKDDQDRLKPGQHLDAGVEANHRLRLAGAIDRLPQLVGFCPHDKPVADADCDPTGDRVVTIAASLTRDKSGAEYWTEERDHVARVWLAGRAELAYPPLAHDGPVTSAIFSPDGSLVATASTDGTARLWEAATGQALRTFRPGGAVARVAFSPDGKTLAAAVVESVFRWDTASGEPSAAPIQVGDPTDYVAYSPEGSKLVTVTLAGKAQVWDAATGKALSEPLPFSRPTEKDLRANRIFIQPMEGQRWPAFSADGKQLATSDVKRIQIWSEAGTKTIPMPIPNPAAIQLGFAPEGTRLIVIVRGSAGGLYELAAGKVVANVGTGRQPAGLAISPDGKWAAVPVSVGNTVLFNLLSPEAQAGGADLSASAGLRAGPNLRIPFWVIRAHFTRDSRRLMIASWDGTVRVWQMAAPELVPEPYRMDCGRADRLEYPDRRFSPDGTWVATYNAPEHILRVGRRGGESTPLAHADVPRYRFSPDGGHIVTMNQDEKGRQITIESWELGGAGPKSAGTTTVAGFVHDLRFSADGRRLGVSVRSRTFKPTSFDSRVNEFFVFDFPSLQPLLGPVGNDLNRLNGGLALSRDGGILVVAQGGTSRLACWDVQSGQRLPGGAIGPGDLNSVDVGLRDDRVLAPMADLGQWDARTGRRAGPTILLPKGLSSAHFAAAYSPDETRIAQAVDMTVAGKSVSRVNVFSALDGDLLATMTANPRFDLPDAWFSTDSRRVIVHRRGTEFVWDWTLPSYGGPFDQVPPLVRLLTGTGSDPVGGFFPLVGDAIRSDPESYRQAFRAWKGLADGGR